MVAKIGILPFDKNAKLTIQFPDFLLHAKFIADFDP